ncbi:hypothetical protein A3B42_02480 [Candidatus Daviesbacteria bacterium RIFCSPLOWO2_01_FULL_38_10]|nr:MAG: hypothetical protein A3B42_02480 [Candidatus Daviesbacteria bacterium RIFCSPLOWO2_01_FULL_38_10]OGE73080.1 MAG: hypothetical protein A3H18_00500 [Candidatus Daviesbacteria bacterium RIFCSPLOWO2_12_FULL_38_10]HBQ50649.1 hypothetical protein [Candidatus Daviesbacteria bacterium]
MIAKLFIPAADISDININHPDTLYFKAGEKMGIGEARKIKEHFSLKPYSAKGRTVIIEDASVMTTEAQNALLKTLEEPPEEAILILAAPSDANLLPTILSRCEIIRIKNKELRIKDYAEDIEKLLNSFTEERFEYIEKLKDRKEFLQGLLNYFHQKLPANLEFTKELLQAEQWAKQNVNLRGILEYLLLKMPKKE